MQLKAMKKVKTPEPAYTAGLADTAGNQDFELTISGSLPLIDRIFGGADFDVRIDSSITSKDAADKLSQAFWNERVTSLDRIHGAPGPTLKALDKKPPRAATSKDSVAVSLRRVKGQGTWWGVWFPGLALPAGANIFFVLPPVCTSWGVAVPFRGDADLFLMLNNPSVAPAAASRNGGTRPDTVSFFAPCLPWTQFVPWLRVNGFTACVTDVGFAGFGVFP